MATTSLFVELIVIGTGAALWIILLGLTIFGYEWITYDRFSQVLSVHSLIPVLSVIYVLGIVTDQIAGGLLDRFTQHLREKHFATVDDYYMARASLAMKTDTLTELVEYSRSRVRICRGWLLNSGLILVFLNLFIWRALSDRTVQFKLSIFASVVLAIIGWACGRAWYSLSQNEYERVFQQSTKLVDNDSTADE